MNLLEQWSQLEETWACFPQTTPYSFKIGSFSICLKRDQSSLGNKLTKAFDHLKTEPNPSNDLTIFLWDTSLPGQKLPFLDWTSIQGNGYRGYWKPPLYIHYFEFINALSVLNVEENRAYYIVRDAETLPWWVSGSPLQVILHTWFQERRIQLTHTAAIGNGKKALLLAGKGGSGKSTTALACLIRGLHYIAEDYSLLSPETSPRVFSIYQTAKWQPHTRTLFPEYEQFIANPEEADKEKALVYYQDIFPKQIAPSSQIQGIVSLEIGKEERPVVRRADFQSTLKNLLMSTLLQLPFNHEHTMSLLKATISQTDHYHLLLGRDMNANIELIEQLL